MSIHNIQGAVFSITRKGGGGVRPASTQSLKQSCILSHTFIGLYIFLLYAGAPRALDKDELEEDLDLINSFLEDENERDRISIQRPPQGSGQPQEERPAEGPQGDMPSPPRRAGPDAAPQQPRQQPLQQPPQYHPQQEQFFQQPQQTPPPPPPPLLTPLAFSSGPSLSAPTSLLATCPF